MANLSLGTYEAAVRSRVEAAALERWMERLWAKDSTLFGLPSGDPSASGYLGWLDVVEVMETRVAELNTFAREVQSAGFQRAVLLGMGGSSLAPLVLEQVFGDSVQGLNLQVVDSTHPDLIHSVAHGDLSRTLFLVASKSGTTAEPVAFDEFFFDFVRQTKGDAAGEQFVAITDPGTELAASAERRGFRKVFLNFPDIGGRFSALSYFGLVPAALIGIDVGKLLQRAAACVDRHRHPVDPFQCAGLLLGAAMGELALQDRDKLTLVLEPRLCSLGLWLEQLIAESTGKHGKGVLPIAGESPGIPEEYGQDRVFAYVRMGPSELDDKVHLLRDAGLPVLQTDLHDPYDVGAEFYLWEIATAVAGAVLQVNPFDQPNVQESKDVTKRVIAEVERRGSLPARKPDLSEGDISLFGPVDPTQSIPENLEAFLRSEPGSYVALMAYLEETPDLEAALAEVQNRIRERYGVVATRGYGPRFLHSTGQFHKGGPTTGKFIQITGSYRHSVHLPGRTYGFGELCSAQAWGDADALRSKGLPVLEVHLGEHPVDRLRQFLCSWA